jgi:hypothetical protein
MRYDYRYYNSAQGVKVAATTIESGANEQNAQVIN